MKKIQSFFQLIRYPNLLFIVFTQLFFYFFIIKPAYAHLNDLSPRLSQANLFILILASVLIAAGGYIINDYFDLNIDKINRPSKMVIDRYISRRWAMLLHLFFSVAGLILTGMVALDLRNPFLFGFNLLSVMLLWFYSTTFKKQLLSGNIIISVLTAWVIFVMFVAEVQWTKGQFLPLGSNELISIYKAAVLYAGFAFITTLIREVIKDIEDELGDRKYGCRTMPISWGMMSTKVFVSVWIIVLIGSLVTLLIYALIQKWFFVVLFILFLLVKYLLNFIVKLIKASSIKHFNEISTDLKWLMFYGILSMILYFYYLG
ncbi:MAG: geranylgeranylglycerol-phosphate geranylgeranyltransferase [bacterium]|jgi:4-hydroxybenzoate polyprenyltransferase